MTFFDERPQARWAVPALAVGIIAAMSFLVSRPASADAGLPLRTAAQLLVDLQQAHPEGLSGTVTQTADLGIPALPGLNGSSPGSSGADSSLTSVLSGTHTWRVWAAGPTQQRLALLGSLGESDIVRSGADLWVWSSKDKTASHRVLTQHDGAARPAPSPTDLPRTPEEAAQRALAAIDPSTEVTTSGAAVVAGRQAYELVLTPRDAASRVAQVRIAVDADKKVPLRVQVYAVDVANPAVDVAFTAVDFAKPDPATFVFTPPPGTTVTEAAARPGAKPDGTAPSASSPADRAATKVVGTGWTAVAVTAWPTGADPGAGSAQQRQLSGALDALPKVSGTWGSGRLVDGTLFSAVLTDDGRLAVGAVGPAQLYAALAAS